MFFYFNRLLFKSISQLPLFTISRFSLSFLSFRVFFLPASLSVRFLSFPHIFLLLPLCLPLYSWQSSIHVYSSLSSSQSSPFFLAFLHPIQPHLTFRLLHLCPPLHFSYLSTFYILLFFLNLDPQYICIVSYLYV